MSQYHSQWSTDNDAAGQARERVLNASRLVPLTSWEKEPDLYTDQFPVLVSEQEKSGKLFTEPLNSVYAPLPAMHTTQSLVITLSSTINPHTGKAPLVIPGSRRLTSQTTPQTEKLPAPRRLHPSVRLGSVVIVTLGILFFTLFSLAPLGSSQSDIPLFNGAIRWAEQQQVTWNGIVTRIQQAEQPPAASTTTTTAPPTTTNPPAAPNLPRGAYVDVARQAAIRYGINPDSFVRQIQQESHFDPNAQSPSGAVGIAQFIPSTAASIGVNPYDPVSALNGAARLMSSLAGQFGGDYAKALAAYNAGPGAVQYAVNVGGVGWLAYMPPETQNYVRIIMG